MAFLNRLLAAVRRLVTPAPPQDRALYVYVKPKACGEVLRVRIDTMNELSRTDDESGYFVRKLARGARCPFQVEIEIQFDGSRRVVSTDITNGTQATQAEYDAYVASTAPR
jgi:hypothetical protein